MRYTNSKSWNPKRPEVPVDTYGNWMDYPGYNQVAWETIEQPFLKTLSIDGMRTGRSSKKVILVDDGGTQYPMFVADLVKGIHEGTLEIREGKLTAWWTGSKRGANYGIKAVNHG